jgi:hypothetical protein
MVLRGQSGVDQCRVEATSLKGLGDPLGTPAAELALVLRVSAREALVVQLAGFDELADRPLDLFLGAAPIAQPGRELGGRPLLASERRERQLERVAAQAAFRSSAAGFSAASAASAIGTGFGTAGRSIPRFS